MGITEPKHTAFRGSPDSYMIDPKHHDEHPSLNNMISQAALSGITIEEEDILGLVQECNRYFLCTTKAVFLFTATLGINLNIALTVNRNRKEGQPPCEYTRAFEKYNPYVGTGMAEVEKVLHNIRVEMLSAKYRGLS